MVKEIRYKLIELARLRTTWTYSQLNDTLQLGLDFSNGYHKKLIGVWLEEITRHEYAKDRPLLNALTNMVYENKEMIFISCVKISSRKAARN
jgi:hypothetical protein